MEQVSADEFVRTGGSSPGCCIIDVRTPPEFEKFHVRGAINLPLGPDLVEQVKPLVPPGKAVYLLCKAGSRAKMAQDQLAKSGISSTSVVIGGTDACLAAGAPIEYGVSNVISIERQIRIAAGSLVLIGIAAGALISPIFYLLSAFVGAGLIFAGVTDRCGMALVLARLPWNRRSSDGSSCC